MERNPPKDSIIINICVIPSDEVMERSFHNAIFARLGSHLVLKDKKVSIELQKPFDTIFKGLSTAFQELVRLELLELPYNRANFENSLLEFPLLSGYGESNPTH